MGFGGSFHQPFGGSPGGGGGTSTIRYLVRYAFEIYLLLRQKTDQYIVQRFKAEVKL